MRLKELREAVCEANLELERQQLVVLTWGNVSGIDREQGVVAIKPSGVPYDTLTPERIVLTDLDGTVVEGDLNPSSDVPTHLALYKAFPDIGGVTHTHSPYATLFAQLCRPIPCFGTTHADHFNGEVPVTRPLNRSEIKEHYEHNTGLVIVERFARLKAAEMPAVLVAHHGPFTWGGSARGSVVNSVALESVARMALGMVTLNPKAGPIPEALLEKHFFRKHGATAYYGQTSG
jgi:L-ribulose-5-phosphate 4-epimerase